VDREFAAFARCELGDDTAAAVKLLASGKGSKGSKGSKGGKGGKAAASQAVAAAAATASSTSPPTALCSYGYDLNMRQYAATEFCVTRQYGKYGSPGGVVCEGAPSIAECPRPWEWRDKA